jgi:hypothetical protein
VDRSPRSGSWPAPTSPTASSTSPVTFDRKLSALCCHESQITDPAALESNLRTWFAGVADLAGLPDGSLAEGFFAIDTA